MPSLRRILYILYNYFSSLPLKLRVSFLLALIGALISTVGKAYIPLELYYATYYYIVLLLGVTVFILCMLTIIPLIKKAYKEIIKEMNIREKSGKIKTMDSEAFIGILFFFAQALAISLAISSFLHFIIIYTLFPPSFSNFTEENPFLLPFEKINELIYPLIKLSGILFFTFLILSISIGIFTFLILIAITAVLKKLKNIKISKQVIEVEIKNGSKEPLGIVMGWPYNYLTIISKDIDSNDKRFVEAHELGHVLGHHIIKLEISGIFLGSNLILLVFLSSMGYLFVNFLDYTLFLSHTLFSGLFLILILRMCEIHADLNVFKRFGPDAYTMFSNLIKRYFNVNHPSKMSFLSRLTHTGRRDITLTTGDPIAALTHWEIPLVFSLLFANMGLISTYIILQKTGIELPSIIFIAFYLSFILTHFVLSFLLAFIIRPIVSRFTSLTSRGRLNLSLLISSIYLVFANIILLLFLINALTVLITVPISYLIILLTVWYFIRDKRRSLMIATVSFAIFILINILILVSKSFIRL